MQELFTNLYGNAKLKAILGEEIRASKNAHAYILSGPEGSGKHLAAYTAAAALGCQNRDGDKFPCGECPHCKKVFKKIHPDIEVYSRGDKASIGVDTIRELREKLYITPNDAETKVIIIEEADKMTVQAQNALLLSLESPPPFVVCFLLVENTDLLLETIKSRAPIIRMQVFDQNKIEEYIEKNYLSLGLTRDKLSNLEKAIALSDGTIGKTVYYLNTTERNIERDFEPRNYGEKVFLSMCELKAENAITLIQELSSSKKDLIKIMEYARMAARDAMATKKDLNASLMFYITKEDCIAKTKSVTIKKIAAIIEALEIAINDLNCHVSKTTILPTLLLKKY